MSKGKKLIIVLGMHCSGTSALTRMMDLLGVDPGSQLLDSQELSNERRAGESGELVRINDALLSELGTHWYDFRALPSEWWKHKSLVALRARSRHFLQAAFKSEELAVITDPRLSLLLPFWEPLIRKSGWQPVVVIVTRAPWEVVTALCHRDPLDESTANLLWLRYYHDAEISSRRLPRCLVEYGALLSDWHAQAVQISRQLNFVWPLEKNEVESLIEGVIDSSLRRQASRFKSSDIEISSLATRVYHKLQTSAADREHLDALWTEFEALFNTCGVMGDTVMAGNARLVEINSRLQTLESAHRQALGVIGQRDQQLTVLNEKLDGMAATHREALARMEALEGQLAEAGEMHGELEQQHLHARQEVEEFAEQLHQLTDEHVHTLAELVQRDGQLAEQKAENEQLGIQYQQLSNDFQRLSSQYQNLRNQPVIKRLAKLLSLE